MALTKSQIRAKINTLTRTKNSYVSERDKYKTSRTYAEKLIRNLNDSNKYLISSDDYMKRYFMINGKTADGGEINKTKDEVNLIIKKINNTILPSINSNINSLNNKITKTEKEINDLRRQYETAQE